MPSFEGIEIDHLSWQEVESAYRLLENSPVARIILKAGELVAVCGPNGSGKSALIHLLAASNISCGKVNLHGSINIILDDSVKKKRCPRCWFDHTRIVPHVDYLVPTLNCEQVIDISLQLNGSSDATTKFLNSMKLGPFSDSLVNKLNHQVDLNSRGNIKKLAILQAISSQPSVLLVDEPAYLVDLNNLMDIVKALRAYAKKESDPNWKCDHCGMSASVPSKKCVIFAFNSMMLSLKWPSIIEFFDKIIFMSVSRQVVFFGSITDAISTIGKGSLEGLLEALEGTYFDKTMSETKVLNIQRQARKARYSVPWYLQVLILLKRHWFQVNNDPKQVFRVILQRIVIFIILSFIFAQPASRSSFLGIFFILPINQTANVLLFTATEGFIPHELIMVEQARFSKVYKSWTLVLAKMLILIPINVFPALIYLPLVFFIAGFRNESSFISFYLANILQIVSTVPLGIFIASSSQDPFIRDLWLFGITTLCTTFGGIHTAANFQLSWILRWIQYLSPTYYLFLILVRLEYTADEIDSVLNLGKFILSLEAAFAVLALLGLLYSLLACISLNHSTKPSRILF